MPPLADPLAHSSTGRILTLIFSGEPTLNTPNSHVSRPFTPPLTRAVALCTAFASALAIASTAPAQSNTQQKPPMSFSIVGNSEYQFKTDIDGGGEFSVWRSYAGAEARFTLSPELDLTFRGRYDYDRYNFSGTATMLGVGAGIDPWENIHTLTASALLSAQMNEQWTLFGGPVGQISREWEAKLGDSWIAGGVVGTTFTFDENLTLGIGIGATNQIEDSYRLFPVFILDWRIVENLRLTTRTISAASGDTGLELVYELDGLELGVGAMYQYRRFRLDSSNAASPGGVGRDTRVPLWGRVGFNFSPNLSASVYAGAVLAGQLRLETATGGFVGSADYDPAWLVGARVSFRF